MRCKKSMYKETKKIINKKMNKKFLISLTFIILIIFAVNSANSQQFSVCCEKTKDNAFCQDTKPENCDPSFRQTPSSCDATSFCKTGCCYDSQEGFCMENTPQRVCEQEDGTWIDDSNCEIPQCQLGCCVLGDQASFVTFVRCKKLSGFYGLETDFRKNINNELECIEQAHSQEKGACVYEVDFIKKCKMTTREECKGGEGNITHSGNSSIKFYKDLLCTAEELGTECVPTTKTTCIEGRDEVYFVDNCGNAANIYDASKIKDKEYWRKIKSKEESCGYGQNNADSAGCGNCDYFLGSICRESKGGDKRPTYGDYICKDLSCKDTSDKKPRKHGESWCVYDGKTGGGKDPVGSRHYRYLCIQGEEIVEPCADFRQDRCFQEAVSTGGETFQQAACIVNRWGDCIAQENKEDCENRDKRDCFWKQGEFTGLKMLEIKENDPITIRTGICLPDVPPGLQFWTESETSEATTQAAATTSSANVTAGSNQEIIGTCSAGSAKCIVEFEKGLIGGEKCKENCECLTDEWAEKMNQVCISLGDCGGYMNFIGKATDDGYQWKINGEEKKLKSISSGLVELTRR